MWFTNRQLVTLRSAGAALDPGGDGHLKSEAPMRRACLSCLSIAVALGAASIGVVAQQARMADGVYSEAQAARGEALYAEYCQACHGPQLTGTEFGPGITGAEFTARWRTRPARDLFDLIRTTMPVNSPGGLSLEQNADLVAFLLKRAGIAAGTSDFPARADTRGTTPSTAQSDEQPIRAAGWYTNTQAARGKTLFMRHCGLCHEGDPSTVRTDAQPDRGFESGGGRSMRHLPIRTYPNVYHVYRRIRDTMPGWDIDAVTPSEKVDILAYLLKVSGLPAGPTELGLDVAAMKKMRMASTPPARVEDGFASLVDGTRMVGLKYLRGFNCGLPPGCGRLEPAGVIRVQEGVIVAEGRYHGMLYTEKKYLDFDLRFDYRWVPPADMDRDDEFFNVSSGYLLFVDEPRIWPKGIEIEGNENALLAGFALGGSARITVTYDTATLARYRKAIGTWNAVQIVSRDGEVKVYLNGGLVTHISDHPYRSPGHIGFQYQGGRIEWRNIRIKG